MYERSLFERQPAFINGTNGQCLANLGSDSLPFSFLTGFTTVTSTFIATVTSSKFYTSTTTETTTITAPTPICYIHGSYTKISLLIFASTVITLSCTTGSPAGVTSVNVISPVYHNSTITKPTKAPIGNFVSRADRREIGLMGAVIGVILLLTAMMIF